MLPLKGKILYENLNTSFIKVEKLLEEVKNKNITGYICFSYPKEDHVLFLKNGKVVNAASLGKEKIFGNFLKPEILKKTRNESGNITVYLLPELLVDSVVLSMSKKPFYENLTTEFTNLKNLLITLEEENFFGFLEALVGEERGYVFLKDGKPEDAFYYDGEKIFEGTKALSMILKNSEKTETIINVFKEEEKKKRKERIEISEMDVFKKSRKAMGAIKPTSNYYYDLKERFGEFSLELLTYINGKRSVKDIVELSREKREKVVKVLKYLYENNFILKEG